MSDRADLMQRWRGYALQRITPDFAWAEDGGQSAAPSLREHVHAAGLSVQVPLAARRGLWLTLGVQAGDPATRAALPADQASHTSPMLGKLATPFRGRTTRTGLVQYFADGGYLDFSVVLVQQRFAASYLDGWGYDATGQVGFDPAAPEASHGLAMEASTRNPLLPGLDWYAGYRSRVNMDTFQNFRGIYGNPGDMDLPARMQFGLAWQALADTELRAGLERVQYSDIEPFVSAALPRRLLAVLGDATSPEFSWRDLDIYSLSVEHRLDARNSLSLRYSTGQQPRPTSVLLDRILMDGAPNYSLGMALVHQAESMQWRVMANYAPSEFILGIPSSAHRNHPESVRQLEFESVWTWFF